MKKWLESHVMVLFVLMLIIVGGLSVALPKIIVSIYPIINATTTITSGDIIKTGYEQGIQGTSIVEIVKEKVKYYSHNGSFISVSRKVIGKTVIGKLVDVEFKETGFFFKKTNVVLTFEDSEDEKKTTIVTANCERQRIWHKGEIQEITIINEKVKNVQIKNYEI